MSALKRRLDKIDGSRGAGCCGKVVVCHCVGDTEADMERKIVAALTERGLPTDARDNVHILYGAWMQLPDIKSRAPL